MDTLNLPVSEIIDSLQQLLTFFDNFQPETIQQLAYAISGETIEPTAEALSALIAYYETNEVEIEAQQFKELVLSNIEKQLAETLSAVPDELPLPEDQSLLDNGNFESTLIDD